MSLADDKIFITYKYEHKKVDVNNSVAFYEADKVLVFDWDGKPLMLYNLDCMVRDIEYDAKTNRLYAIKTEPEIEIVYFELP